MTKNGSQYKIMVFFCPCIPKTVFLIIILAVRGQGKNLVIDKNSIVKKWEFEKLSKTHVIYLKIKVRTCRIQIQVKKLKFVTKIFGKNDF